MKTDELNFAIFKENGEKPVRLWLAVALLLIWAVACRAQDPTFSDAVGMLAQERSYAEGGAAQLKRYAPDDIEGRAGYAQAKAAFDGLIEQLLADLAQNQDPAVSRAFRDRLDVAVSKRVAFSERVNEVLKDRIPTGAKPALLDALAKAPAGRAG